jgi:SPP1 gp7 family putative phage head morphogenesis protein
VRFNLASLAKRRSRRPIDLAAIRTTLAQRDDLFRIYLRALASWDGAANAVEEQYERALNQALRTDSIDPTGSTIDGIAEAINRLVLELTPELRRWAFRLEGYHRGKWLRSILSAVSVDLSTILGTAEVQETIGAFLTRNTSLIRDVNEQTRGRVADAVFRGFQARSPARDVAKEIAEAAGMARARALRIASHQTVNLAAALDAQRHRQAGIDHWKWRWSHKKHGRAAHMARDGKVYTDETAPEDTPGELPNCGCVKQAVLVFPDE